MSPENAAPDGQPARTSRLLISTRWISFFGRFVNMAGAYWTTDCRWEARALTAGLTVLTVGQVVIPVILNKWNQLFFDALEQGAMNQFLTLVGALLGIVAANVAITVLHLYVKRRLQLGWREWLTNRILGQWIAEGRHYLLDFMPGEHDNPDGRIAEDIRNATEFAVDLAHSLVYCLLLLISFTAILWELSGDPRLSFDGMSLYVPGHLVWIAFVYASIGSTAAWLLGEPMVGAQKRRQRFEATFRFGLAHVREHSLQISLLHGDRNERRTLHGRFRAVMGAWNRQTRALVNFEYFTSSWSVLSMVFPVLVAAPRYITGAITLGGLMQTAQAFQQMVGALSWPIDNMGRLADWRASAERVLGIRDALSSIETTEAPRRTIDVVHTDVPAVAFENVAIFEPSGALVVGPFSIAFEPGQRIQVTGDSITAFKFLKAVAGLWPWGEGRIELPNEGAISFIPRDPYLPLRSLRATVTYPRAPSRLADADIHAALERVGLARLIPDLDKSDHWGESLSMDDQRRIGFARLLLIKPRWIFIHEAIDALEERPRRDMLALLDKIFPDAAIIIIGRHPDLEVFCTHRLEFAGGVAIQLCTLPSEKTV